jgi:hypothetical protein
MFFSFLKFLHSFDTHPHIKFHVLYELAHPLLSSHSLVPSLLNNHVWIANRPACNSDLDISWNSSTSLYCRSGYLAFVFQSDCKVPRTKNCSFDLQVCCSSFYHLFTSSRLNQRRVLFYFRFNLGTNSTTRSSNPVNISGRFESFMKHTDP